MSLIQLEGMEFYAYHGCFKEEQLVGNRFILDLTIETDCTRAAATDSLNVALNYQEVYNVIREQIQQKSHLLENLTAQILDLLEREFPQIQKMTLKVSKMNPPLGGQVEKVSVTMERSRNQE